MITNNINTGILGEQQVYCRYIMMNGIPVWVCTKKTGGGGSMTPGGGKAVFLGSEADLIATYMRDLQDSQANIAYYNQQLSLYPGDPEMTSRLAYWTARAAALNYLLSKGAAYIRQQGAKSYDQGGDLIAKTMKKYQTTIDKVNNTFNPNGDWFDSIVETVQSDSILAGFPNWALIGLAGAAAFFIFGNNDKKTQTRRAA